MKISIIFTFLFLFCISSWSEINLKETSKENITLKSGDTAFAYPIFSIGLFKQLYNSNNKEINPFMFNLGLQLFFKLNPRFGLAAGIDANKYTGGGIFLHISFIPHFRISSGNSIRTYIGTGLTGGIIYSENSRNGGINAGYVISFKIEKQIRKSMGLSFDLKTQHYLLSNVQIWGIIFNAGILFN